MKASALWDMPDLRASQPALKVLGYLVNDWQLSTIWTGLTGAPYTVSASYQNGGSNVNITGSPDFAPRIRHRRRSGRGLQQRPVPAVQCRGLRGTRVGSVGLESGNDYLKGCFSSVLDLSIARNIRLGGSRMLQLRVDMFNAPNSAQITDRNTSLTLTSPNDPVTAQNLPYGPDGNILPNRVRPNQAGFGAVNAYQTPRNVQVYVRFSF